MSWIGGGGRVGGGGTLWWCGGLSVKVECDAGLNDERRILRVCEASIGLEPL